MDTHCHRIPNRLKWFKTTTPDKSKEKLEALFDESEWKYVNEVIVGFGQLVCSAKQPSCDICPINALCLADENFMMKKTKKINVSTSND